MNTKLTLTIDNETILKAKHYAQKKGRSLSDIIENYLKAITTNHKESDTEISPLVKSLIGTFKAPKEYDYKKELSNILSEKYDK